MAKYFESFEYSEKALDTGLRGIPVGLCPSSKVDPYDGLSYSGFPIADLAYKAPEEVIHLLMYGQLPNQEQLDLLNKELVKHSRLHTGVIEGLKVLPKDGHPMKWFLAGLNLMGLYNGKTTYHDDALKVIAKIPTLVAAIFRIRSGWGEPIESKPELGYMENFYHMLGAPKGTEDLKELLKVFNILHMDHGGGNLSTFVGKAIASGHEDIYGSLVGAMAGLAGPLHGAANQECLRFLRKSLDRVGSPENEEAIRQYIEALWERGEKIYGFGHAVLRVEDPRATVLFDLGEKLCADSPLFQMARVFRKLGSEFLKTQPKVADPYPNVDQVSGSLLASLGLPDESYYTVLFGMARCVGIACQIVYEREEARDGKGTPIIRPKYIYSGPTRPKCVEKSDSESEKEAQ